MSDRTHLTLKISDCPASQAQAVIDLIDQHGLHPECDQPGQPADDQLGLGLAYMDHEVTCGSAQEISTHLQRVAPEASWEVHEDPAYEWFGDLYRFTPGLGVFTAECDAQGEPVFTPAQIRPMAYLPDTPDEPALSVALGEAHREALADLDAENDGVVIVPD